MLLSEEQRISIIAAVQPLTSSEDKSVSSTAGKIVSALSS